MVFISKIWNFSFSWTRTTGFTKLLKKQAKWVILIENSVTRQGENVQQTEQEDSVVRQKYRVTSNAVLGISILRDLGDYWSPAALSAAATAMRRLFMSGGLAWLNSFAYRRMDQAGKRKQICACDNLQPPLSRGFTAGRVGEIHSRRLYSMGAKAPPDARPSTFTDDF